MSHHQHQQRVRRKADLLGASYQRLSTGAVRVSQEFRRPAAKAEVSKKRSYSQRRFMYAGTIILVIMYAGAIALLVWSSGR